MTSEEPKPQRLTRAEAKARTRRLLLDAAARTFARKGFAGSSVEEIADAAGYSIGALYSNFSNKEELFLELAAAYNADRIARAADVLAAGGDDAVGAMGQLLIDTAERNGDVALLQAEFWLYAVRNPQVMDRLVAHLRRPRAALEDLIADTLTRQAAPQEATPQAVGTIVVALFEGLVRQRRINPELVPTELFGLALRWLFAGMAGEAEPKTEDRPAG